MAIHATDKTLIQFINPQEDIEYRIPTYQREYSWRVDHCEDLLNDILENDENYFIGSIIWITDRNEIIDGQQRLTSINLLLIAIYNRYLSFDENEDIVYKKSSLKRMLVHGRNNRLVPQRQGRNKEDFEYLIKSNILREACGRPINFGNRRVGRNFKYFDDAIRTFSLQDLNSLFSKITKLKFISAEVDDYQTAFILFETMNNRGMELSAIDLIKNSYISRTHDDNCIENWENLIDILGSEANQEQFLRNNYNAFRREYNNLPYPLTGDVRYSLGNKATKSNVIKIYSSLVDRHDFIEFLTTNARFNSLLTCNDNPTIEVPQEFKNYFKKIRNANATSSFTLLLFLLRNQIRFNINDDQMCSLFELILRFFIRRNITNNPSTGALPQIQMDIISGINRLENPDYDSVRSIIYGKFIDKTSPNDIIKEILNGDVYESIRDITRYLLCDLCEFEENNERRFIDLWEKRDEKYIWTIEHIMPEGNRDASNIPQPWLDMIKYGNLEYTNYTNDQIIELVKTYRHKIGNLTMTGYNSSLGNKPFNEKKNRTNDDGTPIGYNNGLSLNDYVYHQDQWQISNIIYRTEHLIDLILQRLELNR